MSADKYILPNWALQAVPMSERFYLAQSELLSPFPATPLKLFPQLNIMTGGLRPHEFSIICGATGSGKTTLCANISRDLLEQGVPQFIASVETGDTDYVKRMISAMEGEDWNTGDPVPLEKLRIFHEKHGGLFKANTAWLSLYDNRTTVERLMSDIANDVKARKTKVAIVDNINFLLAVTSAKDAVVEMDRVVHELIIFCKQVPVHILMLAHPKKTDHSRVESEFDIKGSSTAVQEAQNVLLWNRPHPDLVKAGTATERDRELKIAKMRRKGKFVGKRLILGTENGVRYYEKGIV